MKLTIYLLICLNLATAAGFYAYATRPQAECTGQQHMKDFSRHEALRT